jgi:hypothetical protein
MAARAGFLAFLAAATVGCAALPPTTEQAPADTGRGRPLDVLPAEARIADVEADLLATARERFGQTALDRAGRAPTHLIVKRFAGMLPPRPPGAGPAPTPAALVIQENRRWLAATAEGWRDANPAAIAELEAIFVGEPFWGEGPFVPACPDFGASNLLLKMPGKARIVRSHQCSGASSRAVEAALRA